MKRFLGIVIILAVLVGCFNWKNINYYRLRKKAAVSDKNFTVTIPMDMTYPIPVIEVMIKGKPYKFIYDTGASNTIISRELANLLNLDKRAEINSGDSKGVRKDLDVTLIDTVSIGGIDFTRISANIIDWPEYSAVECIATNGLIGNNLIQQCNWLLDYQSNTITLTDDNTLPEEMSYVTMKSPKGRPYIEVTADNLKLNNVLLDLGSGGSLDVSRSIISKSKFDISQYQRLKVIDGSSQGLYGSRTDTVINMRMNTLQLGKYAIEDPIIDIERKRGAKIGNRILKKFRLFLSYSNEKVGFQPYDSTLVYGGNDGLGFSPGMNDKGLYIASVVVGSPAWQKGIRYGDIILSIEDKSANEFKNYCDFIDYIIQDLRKVESVKLLLEKNKDSTLTIDRSDLWVK